MKMTLFRTITEDELVEYLLAETGQADTIAVSPADLLAYLKLSYFDIDFTQEIPEILSLQGAYPRAVLSIPEQ